MTVDGLVICDFCHGVIFPNEGTPVRLEKDGHTHSFDFHNRHSADCLAQKIEQLRLQFAQQADLPL